MIPFPRLTLLAERFAIARLAPYAAVPAWANSGTFSSISRTTDELSIVCAEHAVPASQSAERGRRAIKLEGPLDFALTGILSRMLVPLAIAKIPVFVISTYDTDYLLLNENDLDNAFAALRAAHLLTPLAATSHFCVFAHLTNVVCHSTDGPTFTEPPGGPMKLSMLLFSCLIAVGTLLTVAPGRAMIFGGEKNPNVGAYVCQTGPINCMPGPGARNKYCSSDYVSWHLANCGGSAPAIVH